MGTAEEAEADYIEAVLKRSGPPYECRICGRELQRGEIMVSLMGNGISCSDLEKCALTARQRALRSSNRRDRRASPSYTKIPRRFPHSDSEITNDAPTKCPNRFETLTCMSSRRTDK